VVYADVVAKRLLALREALSELDRPGAGDALALAKDALLRAAVERWMQVAIEACIDLAQHKNAADGLAPAASGRESFRMLGDRGVIDPGLASRLGDAVGMRNLLVHDYVRVDLEALARAVREDRADLVAFGAIAAGWITGV
jgi:uncharacterized protein YutE (UPF0331/DUF86 family)